MISRRARTSVLCTLCLMILLPVLAAAQTAGTVEGKVVAAKGAEPLADVFVKIDGTNRGAFTDAGGRFRLTALPSGHLTMVTQRFGYAPQKQEVNVTAGSTASISFELTEAATLIEPMVVVASREAEKNHSSARIDALDGADVRQARASHPGQIMNRIAGVHVSELSGEGHSMAIRQPITTKPMYLYLEDGVPTRPTGFFNHNALYEVNIPQSGGIEVLKGPGTALYGSDAIGGVVNVLTRPAPATPEVEGSFEGGAFGYRRVLATGGFTSHDNGVRADLNITRSSNWKDDAPFHRQSGTIRWDALNVGGWQVKTVLTGSRINQFDVPTVNKQLWDNDPAFNSAPSIAYRRVRALRVSSAFEKQSGSSLWSFTPFARYNVMELLPSWQLTYDPQVWDTRNNSGGLLAKYRRDLGFMDARLIAGADFDYSPGSFTANRAVVTRTNGVYGNFSKGEAQYDYDVTYHQASPYAQLEINPIKKLKLDFGLREDLTGYNYTNNLSVVDTGAHRRPADTNVSYTHLSPKAGAVFEAAREVSVFASYRHGFRAPSQGQLFQQNSAAHTVDLEPVKVDSYEGGVRGQLGERFVYQVSAYDMTIKDDIITFVTATNTREAVNAGRTRHKGIEASAGIALAPELRLDAAYSISSQKYVEWVPQAARGATAAIDYSGKLIEQAPRDLASAQLTYSPKLLNGGRLGVEWSHTGRYAADPANTFFYEGYHLLSLSGNVILKRNAELFARLSNLTNSQYAELVSYDAFQKDQYTPGAPRSFYLGMRLSVER